MTRVCFDLFSGKGGFSQAFRESDEWRVVTVDDDPQFEPDICQDVMHLDPRGADPDVVLASPPCHDMSVANQTDKWEKSLDRRPHFLPRKASIAHSVMLVFRTLWFVYEWEPDFWYLENPQGMLRTWIGPPVGQVHYCQYGSDHRKATDLWGRHPPMEYRRCPGKPQCDHLTAEEYSGTLRDMDSAEVAKVPYQLSAAILEAVEDAYANPPPEQSKLADGGFIEAIEDGDSP